MGVYFVVDLKDTFPYGRFCRHLEVTGSNPLVVIIAFKFECCLQRPLISISLLYFYEC